MLVRPAVLFVAVLLIGGCAARQGVTHVVVCYLQKPGDEDARNALIDESLRLGRIPGVVRVTAGPRLPAATPRPVIDDDYDVLIVMEFRDAAALEAYQAHPLHQQAVRRVLRPLVARYVIYDAQTMNRSRE